MAQPRLWQASRELGVRGCSPCPLPLPQSPRTQLFPPLQAAGLGRAPRPSSAGSSSGQQETQEAWGGRGAEAAAIVPFSLERKLEEKQKIGVPLPQGLRGIPSWLERAWGTLPGEGPGCQGWGASSLLTGAVGLSKPPSTSAHALSRQVHPKCCPCSPGTAWAAPLYCPSLSGLHPHTCGLPHAPH